MIYDRPYMQEDFRPKQFPVLKWIILSTIAVFVLQQVFGVWFHSRIVNQLFALSVGSLSHGFVWTILTYAFLHGHLMHILGNMLLVFFIGRELVPILGVKRFTQLYVGGAVLGGTVWLVFAFAMGSPLPLLGASGAAIALLTVFACIYPNKPITLLLFFILPVTIRPKYVVFVLLAVSIFGLLFLELPGETNTAHSAHLGGMLGGWLFHRYIHSRPERSFGREPRVEPPGWFKKKKTVNSGAFTVNITNRRVLQKEVDRILDKINSQGFGSLSDEEKKILDRARDLLNR